MATNAMVTAKKQVRTLYERLTIIEEIEKNPGEKRVDAAKRLGLPPSTLNSIMAKKREIREQADKCGKASKIRKTGKKSSYSDLEMVLFTWYQEAKAADIPIDGTIIREKGKQIAEILGIQNFAASNGWIARFKDRHGLVHKKHSRARTAVNPQAAEKSIEKIPALLKGYAPGDVYNAYETGLFFGCLPDKCLDLKGQSCRDGRCAQERVTVLLCASSDGSHKLEPIVIGNSSRPQCFKNLKTLPVKYYANKKAWMTTAIFTEFLRLVDDVMGAQHRKILMFVETCAAHPQDTSFLKNVTVVFHPPNCAGVWQPPNVGVIKCFKQYYRKRLVQRAACLMENGDKLEAITITLFQAAQYVLAAWQQVPQASIANYFNKYGYGGETNPEEVFQVEDIEHFQNEWEYVADGCEVDFDTYVLCDSELVIWGNENVDLSDKDEGSEEDADDPIPTFSAAQDALEKLKTFFYAHDIDDHEKCQLLNLETSLFNLKRKL